MKPRDTQRYGIVPTDFIRWQLRNRTYEKGHATDADISAEITGIVAIGELHTWSCRQFMDRFKCGQGRIIRVLRAVLDVYRNMNGTVAERYVRTIIECFPKLSGRSGTVTERERNHARASSLKREEEEVDTLSDKSDDVADGFTILSDAWVESGPRRRALTLNTARRKALTKHLHGTKSVDKSPIADLLTAWRWMLTSDHWRAVRCREGGSAAIDTLLRTENGGKLHEYLALANEVPTMAAAADPLQAEAERWWAQACRLADTGTFVRSAEEFYSALGGTEEEPTERTRAAWGVLDSMKRLSTISLAKSQIDRDQLRKQFIAAYRARRSGLRVVEGGAP